MPVDRTFTPEVERFLSGELSEAEITALRQKLGDAELSRIKARHAREHELLMRERTPEEFARLIQAKRARERTKQSTKVGFLASGLAAAAALVLWLAPSGHTDLSLDQPQNLSDAQSHAERLKGLTPEISIFRKTPQGVEALAQNAEVRARDVLQVAYSAAGMSYGAVLSIDGSGTVTLHSPYETSERALLTPQGKHMLNRSYELDEAPEFERFFLVTSRAPLDVSEIVRAAERLARDPQRAKNGKLDLPTPLMQTSFLLRKAEP